METETRPSFLRRIKNIIIGGARSPNDPQLFHKLSLIAFFAWIGLGADGLSSSSYGPEEAFRVLQNYPHLALFVALGSVITIFVISAGYSQIIELFPHGGGGYLVASKLLSPKFGMIAGCALIVDYVLTITISVASGADAIFSFLPPEFLPYRLSAAALGVVVLIILNLRGVKESVVPLVPIFLAFILTHAFGIIYAIFTHLPNAATVASNTIADVRSVSSQVGYIGLVVLLLRSYSVGAGTYTGIEAVSNGLPILREPQVETGKQTMRYMAISLAVTVFGLMLAYVLFAAKIVEGKTLNAVLFESMTKGWGDAGYIFVLVTLLSEAAILFIAAQTGFLGGPRVLANMAQDRWFPTKFALLSDRLVTYNGILLMGGAALVLMLLTGGSVRFLVVLYSINVFITFTLSQSGMVRHWWMQRKKVSHWYKKLFVNGVGFVMCAFILIAVTIIKFHEGGWITLLVTGAMVLIVILVKRHYEKTSKLLRRLDSLVAVAQESSSDMSGAGMDERSLPQYDPTSGTAVLLVNGFNGLGLHTLFGVIRLFRGVFKNFIFLQVGVVDAGVFKGSDDVEKLKAHVETDMDKYVEYMNRHGFYAKSFSTIGTDIIGEVMGIAPQILERFPQSVFFGGQIVFPEERFFSRWLHNYIVFAIQRRFYHRGIPFVILPIRV